MRTPRSVWKPRWLAAAVLLFASGGTLSAQGKAERPGAVDSRRDPRLARRVGLSAEGIPLSRVLQALSTKTGVRLTASGRAADERLVAFVPGSPLSEVMAAVADLYRLEWLRAGTPERPVYELRKAPSAAREEAAIRDGAFRQVLGRLAERLRNPDTAPKEHLGNRPGPWVPVYPDLLPILAARGQELVRTGFIYLNVGALTGPEGGRILGRLRPILAEQDARRDAFLQQMRQEMLQMGVPEAALGEPHPPSAPEKCTLTLELGLDTELQAMVGLRTHTGTWYNWFQVRGDDTQQAALALYADRRARVPEAPGGREEAPVSGGDAYSRSIDLGQPAASKGDWIGALRKLSTASGLPLYADCYSSQEGGSSHPRSALALGGKVTPAQALDAVAFPVGNWGTRKLKATSFWWRRGDAALVRSSRWVWESATVLPADLTELLAASMRKTGKVDPDALPGLAALDFLQVQGLAGVSRHMDHWQLAVQVPARLSLAARTQVVSGGLKWSQVLPPDRALLANLAPPPGEEGGDEKLVARVSGEVLRELWDGVTMLNLYWQAPGMRGGHVAHIPLWSISLPPEMKSRAVEVSLLP